MAVTSPQSGPDNATVDHYHGWVPIQPDSDSTIVFERLRERIFTYDIFPRWCMRSAICPPGRVTDGATIVQRVVFGPLALEMAVRVIAVWDRHDGKAREAGFSYTTLTGHAECGVETFQARLDADGRVMVAIDARSMPGSRLTLLGRPVARLIQVRLTKAALRRLCQP